MIHYLHTTLSAHPNKCPPQCPSPILLFPPPLHEPSVCSLYLRVSYGLPPSLFETIFPLIFPHVLLLSFSKSTYEWKHMISVFLWMTYFTSHTTFQFHPCCCKWHDFILSHCQVISIVYINHIFSHSSVDGHLCSLHNLVIVDSINVGVHVPLWISTPVSLGYMPSSAIAGLLGNFIFSFLRNLHSVFQSSGTTHAFPPTVQENSHFCTSLPMSAVSCVVNFIYPDRCEVVSQCGFDLYFPDDERPSTSLHVPVGHLDVFFGSVYSCLLPISSLDYLFFGCWVWPILSRYGY